jgi:hypothetical protein
MNRWYHVCLRVSFLWKEIEIAISSINGEDRANKGVSETRMREMENGTFQVYLKRLIKESYFYIFFINQNSGSREFFLFFFKITLMN